MTLFIIKPKDLDASYARIEEAASPSQACTIAYGRGLRGFEYKPISRGDARSDKKRIAAISSPDGWKDVFNG